MDIFSSPKSLADDLKQGKMIVLLDDEDRENEGDLVLAANWVTPEAINFMATHGRGLICLALDSSRCDKLKLPMMVNHNGSPTGTNFTVSIESKEGVTTGISAHDRAKTIATAIAENASPEDLVQPGHIFPLRAQDGGVLVRAGHTEAACDFAKMAGFEPAAVIVEILNQDGTMARRPELEKFAQEHNLLIGTIAELIEHRLNTETSVTRTKTTSCPSPWNNLTLHSYYDQIHKRTHIALVKGELEGTTIPLVRVHQSKGIVDLLSLKNPSSKSWTFHNALEKINKSDCGVLVLLNFEHNKDSYIDEALSISNKTIEQESAIEASSRNYVSYGIGAQILRDLGVSEMNLLSSPSIHFRSLSGFGLEVKDIINIS